MGLRTLVVCMGLLCALSGCVGGWMGKCLTGLGVSHVQVSPPGPLMEPVIGPPPDVQGCEEPNELLTLSRALWLAHIYNPDLAAFSYETRICDAKVLQASLKPNPTAGVVVENFGGTGDASGSESAETTITLSQIIPLGGKISKRVQVAGLDRDLAGWDYEAKRVAVMTETARRFVRVLVAQENLKVAREQVTLAEEVFDVSNKRFRAGETSIVDKTRSEAVLATSRIGLQKAGYRLTDARQALAAMWGNPQPKFKHVQGNLYALGQIPDWNIIASQVTRNPDLARWATEMSKRWADVQMAKSQGIPDVTVGFGVRRINQLEQQIEQGVKVPVPNDTALVAQLSLPIPTFDRNQGNVRASKTGLAKGEQERRAAWTRVQTALSQSYIAVLSAHTEASSIRGEVIPRLQSAFEGVRKGYWNGKMGYIDLVQAQEALVEERRRYIQALGDYHNARAELEGLIGQSLRDMR